MADMPFHLHIGGREAKQGWTVLNAQPGPGVDIVGDLRDLSLFEDASVTQIYASHVLEHLAYSDEVLPALKGCHRILVPGGTLMLSVPDLDRICRLMIHDAATVQVQYQLMRMLFGGQTDEWDYHKTGFTAELLAGFLGNAGFDEVRRVDSFDLFDDTSNLTVGDVPVSLNVVAVKEVS
ncbi:methyltransferase domain-containing protein [Hwanghaeella grinnelliae]|uniref:Methyltransferase domain-containing protein n=1 Tax=Hwanghaeella grinnelliae TaxID=2500179 RepID=A0A437QJI9_9PROT|nr:methyltransferase domain-containing protein [Hwanghaeella grinnelliae]RVU34674.1 methyltransferase domain-containing protein [Hwanghaeella grinnelliae]